MTDENKQPAEQNQPQPKPKKKNFFKRLGDDAKKVGEETLNGAGEAIGEAIDQR